MKMVICHARYEANRLQSGPKFGYYRRCAARDCFAEVLALEPEFSAENTQATARKGGLIQNIIPGEFDNGGPPALKPSCRTRVALTFTVETCTMAGIN